MKLEKIYEDIAISEAAATPNILSSESDLYLIFYLHDESLRNPETTAIFNVGLDTLIRLQFPNYISYRFGSPNSESLENHPLFELGLENCTIYKVLDSLWLDELEEDYRDTSQVSDEIWESSEHYIFTFKDSCFEIIANKIIIERNTELTMKEELASVADRL